MTERTRHEEDRSHYADPGAVPGRRVGLHQQQQPAAARTHDGRGP